MSEGVEGKDIVDVWLKIGFVLSLGCLREAKISFFFWVMFFFVSSMSNFGFLVSGENILSFKESK